MMAMLGVLAVAMLLLMLVAAWAANEAVSERASQNGSYQHYLHGVNSPSNPRKE